MATSHSFVTAPAAVFFASMTDSATLPAPQFQQAQILLGIAPLDAQHNQLDRLLQRLLEWPGAAASDEHVVDILSLLGQQLIDHFEAEERHMHAQGMAPHEIERHRIAHNQILDQYAQLNLDTVQGRPRTAAEIGERVKVWVRDHLHTFDYALTPAVGEDRS